MSMLPPGSVFKSKVVTNLSQNRLRNEPSDPTAMRIVEPTGFNFLQCALAEIGAVCSTPQARNSSRPSTALSFAIAAVMMNPLTPYFCL